MRSLCSRSGRHRSGLQVEQLEAREVPACWALTVVSIWYGVSNTWTFDTREQLDRALWDMRNGGTQVHGWAPVGEPVSLCGVAPTTGTTGSTNAGIGGSLTNHSLDGTKDMVLNMAMATRLPRNAMFPGWQRRASGWRAEVRAAQSSEQLADLLLEFERRMTWQAVKGGWRSRRPTWMRELSQATTPHQVNLLAVEFRSYIRRR